MERQKSDVSYSEETPDGIQGSKSNLLQNEISSFRVIASQFLAILPIICFQFRIGMELGFTAILTSEIFKKNSEIDVSLSALSWFSSYCFVIPAAAIFGGVTAQYAGIRKLLMCSYVLYILADLIFHWADNTVMILSAQAIVGFTKGMSKMPSYTYAAEIIQSKFRSTFMAIINLSALTGIFLSTLLGNFLYWRTQALVSLICPAFGFLLIRYIPNSPYWLASKNRFDDAEKSLASLRGWTTREAIRTELYSSISNAPNSFSSAENAREMLELNLRKEKRENWKKTLLCLDRSFYIPLFTMISIFFFGSCNGASSFMSFSGLIFDKINSPISGHVGSVVFSATILIGSFIYIFTIRLLGIRIVTLASVLMVTIGFLIAAALLHAINNNQPTFALYSWTVSVALTMAVFAHHTGIGKVILFLNSELYPQKLRYIGSGIGIFIFEIMVATSDKAFLYIVDAMTLAGALILFAIINAIGFVVIYFILPETVGLPLSEIEAHYAGKRNLNTRSLTKRRY